MNGTAKKSPPPELTQRQRQILKLLQAGKVNKEVARELDIGVGTVKQHIVALFKKLNVSNRAMAVSRGMDIMHEQESRGSALTVDGLLERRPCVVLSIALPEDANLMAVRLMHGTLAALAAANDAVFLARKGNAGDVIFGIQRVTEYDLAIALQTACAVHDDLLGLDVAIAGKMRGCLTAGLAVASMKRFGGWTGEAIASAAIAAARDLLQDVQSGWLAFDAAAMDLMEVFGIGAQHEVLPNVSFDELKRLQWTGSRRSYHLVGREAELATLDAALNEAVAGRGKLVHIEGEMGMGKSRLCEEVFRNVLARNGIAAFYRGLPAVLGKQVYDIGRGVDCSLEDVTARLCAPLAGFPDAVIVDDFHLLDKEQQAQLSSAAAKAVEQGRLVIFSGRRGLYGSGDCAAETIALRRLPAESIEALVRESLAASSAKVASVLVKEISDMAAGVPLFAAELARHREVERLALPLLVAINARLDSLSLDRNLLRTIAKSSVNTTLAETAATMGEDAESLRQQVERTVAAGVFTWGTNGWISFTHPLLRLVIDSLVME